MSMSSYACILNNWRLFFFWKELWGLARWASKLCCGNCFGQNPYIKLSKVCVCMRVYMYVCVCVYACGRVYVCIYLVMEGLKFYIRRTSSWGIKEGALPNCLTYLTRVNTRFCQKYFLDFDDLFFCSTHENDSKNRG